MKSAYASDYALTVYGGCMTEDAWEESLFTNVNFIDAYIVAGALTITEARLYENALAIEVEGQVARAGFKTYLKQS
jgi:hypothetical protein